MPRAAQVCYNSYAALQAPLAQLDRASGYEPEGREFESLRARHRTAFFQALLPDCYPERQEQTKRIDRLDKSLDHGKG